MDPRTPILVGIGTAHRPPDGSAGVEPIELMAEAVLAAGKDAGAPGLVARARSIAVPGGNWTYPDPARLVAERIGAADARTVLSVIGVPQVTPVNVALDRIRRGELDVAIVVGGEAMASRLRAERTGRETPGGGGGNVLAGNLGDNDTAVDPPVPDETWVPEGEFMAEAEVQTGMWAPVEQYACIDNALRVAEGGTIDQHLDEIAALWAGFNRVAQERVAREQVAQHHAAADFAEPRDAAFLRQAGPGNRALAFPYAKWHVSQWSVDQAAALILCSVGVAEAAGVSRDRWIFPAVSVESSFACSLTKRAEMHRWPAMAVLGAAAADHIGRSLDEVDHVELYSCFPAAVRVQQRELGLPHDGIPTLTGGMTFAGGPFNNFTYQATAAVVERLRAAGDGLGMVTTVSGLLTKPGLTVWSAHPPERDALVLDLVDTAREATAVVDVTSSSSGAATVATYTVTYEPGEAGDEPAKAFVVADLPDGRRWIGTSRSADLLAAGVGASGGELIGTTVVIDGTECAPA